MFIHLCNNLNRKRAESWKKKLGWEALPKKYVGEKLAI